jgi:hypothetical protein
VYHQEKQTGLLCNVHGKVSMEWLSVIVEMLVRGEGLKELFKSSRVGSKAFVAQRCSNSRGRFLF